jgi:Domain of unknown function (DUF4936)
MSWSFYIYYRVEKKDAGKAEARVRNMQVRLASRTAIAGRLLAQRDDPLLWMEVYEGVNNPNDFEQRLIQAVDEFGIDVFLAGDSRRHLECFKEVFLASPACVPD